MEVTAPAKINLYLRVVRKLDDGYHEIETLFERISIFDRIVIEPSQNGTIIQCDDPKVPTDEESLLGKTVKAFREESGKKEDFYISLEKNIPISAGMGGGSSDAAALLKGMNEMTGSPLEKEALLKIGRTLGADIPFFLSGCSFGHGTGRGDIIEKLETPHDLWHVVVNPPFEVATKDVYSKTSAFALTKNRGVDRMISAFSIGNNIKEIAENLRNDLQDIVLREFPSLEQVFSELREAGAEGVLLSGSGPTVFGIFTRGKAEKTAEDIKRVFSGENWRVYVARTY
ncbi:MAG: 4-(cytidine 5'-diphospho)-2-C-methyl-D-erythritol kinase [Candidatus Omnitrophota bacterium]